MASKAIKEVKPKVNKCKYCTGIIADADLGIYPQLDMKRNLKYKKNTKGELRKDANGDLILLTFKAHKLCHEKKEAERIAWDNLYMYILGEYFGKIVPPNAIVRLQDMRNGSSRMGKIINSKEGYSYKLILECFQEFESEIKKYIDSKNFNDDAQRGNYLMTIIEKKIDGFEGKKEAAVVLQTSNEIKDFKFLENKKTIVVQQCDYDFLD